MTTIIENQKNSQIIFKEILSKNPYFDDFDNTSSFYKILFRSDKPLQTRELNQIQSILQKQIERLGSYVFKNGSIVSGCENRINFSVMSGTVSNITDSDLEKFNEKTIISLTDNTKKANISFVLHQTKNKQKNESLIFYNSVSGQPFYINEEVALYDPETNEIFLDYKLIITDFRNASFVFFSEGIIFVNGYFLYIPKQKQIIDGYSNKPSKSLGFAIIDSIVTYNEDESLFDNAFYTDIESFSNPKAFGADRYKIVGNLEVREIISNNNYAEQSLSGNFFEFIRIDSGTIVKNVTTTIYSEVEKILARRTYDESGSYTVRPFAVKVRKSNQNLNNFTLEISPGKAYVLGYEFDSIATRYVEIPRSLAFESQQSFDFSMYFGSYVKLNNFSGFFDVQKCARVFLCNKLHTEYTTPVDADILGTARVKHCKKLGSILFVYLFDIILTSGTFEQVKSISVQLSSEGSGRGSLDVSKLYDANNSSFVYKLNDQVIKSLDSASFSYQKVFLNQKFSSSIDPNIPETQLYTNIKVTSNEQLGTSPSNYIVVNKANNQYITPSKVIFSDNDGQNVQLEIVGDPEGIVCDILAIVDIKNAESKKAKEVTKILDYILKDNQVFKKGEIVNFPGVFLGFKLVSVSTEVNKNLINLFELVNNENDNYFSEIQIKYIGSEDILFDIKFEYIFSEYPISGYFDINSFNTIDTNIILPDIRLSNNKILNRKNCLDFRPFKNSNNEIVDAIIPNPSGTFECDYSYYLSRQDKLVITSAKTFDIVSGISALNPNIPAENEEKMTLYSFFIPAGTDNPDLVKLTFYENKRYTMRDIGKLEQRIKNLEYYSSLSLLEKDIESFEIKDTSGNNRFKNGFLVDNFKNYKSLDYSNPDVNCSYDLKLGLLRPSFDMMNIKAVFDEQKSNAILAGELIMIPYQSVPFIQQLQCSEILNLQPFEVFTWDGGMTLDPEIDEWVDTETKPNVTVNHFDENDIWEEIGSKAFKTEWKSWETKIVKTDPELPLDDQSKGDFANISTKEEMRLWNPSVDMSVGADIIQAYNDWVRMDFKAGFTKTKPDGYVDGAPAILMPFKSATELTIKKGTSDAFDKSKIINNSLGEKVTSTEIVAFIRSQKIKFAAKNLKPNTKIFAFFDDRPVSEFCYQNDRYYAGLLQTDEKGKISGTFILPGGVFNCGSKIFRLCDEENNNSTFITTVCERKFTANGLKQTKQDTFLSTREPQLTKVEKSTIKPKNVFAWGNIEFLPTPTPTPSITPTQTPTPSGTITPTPSITPTTTSTSSLTPTQTPNVSPSSTQTPSITPTSSKTPGVSSSPTQTPPPSPVVSPPPGVSKPKPSQSPPPCVLNFTPKFSKTSAVFGTVFSSRTAIFTASHPDFYVSPGGAQPNVLTTLSLGVNLNRLASLNHVTSVSVTINNVCKNIFVDVPVQIRPILGVLGFSDPLAQSFTIEHSEYSEGVFLTGVDLFFKTKSETKPVRLELRQTVNGFPHSSEYIPFAQKYLDPEEVFVSNDASIPTHFAFDSPIYLKPGEFTFCVIADTNEYNVFISKLGGYLLGSATERIDKNVYSGTLFKSANASTWLPQPDLDFKFVLYRSSFTTNQEVSVTIVNNVPSEGLHFPYNSICFNAMTVSPANTNISIPKHNLIQENLAFSTKDYEINFNESSELDNTFIIREI